VLTLTRIRKIKLYKDNDNKAYKGILNLSDMLKKGNWQQGIGRQNKKRKSWNSFNGIILEQEAFIYHHSDMYIIPERFIEDPEEFIFCHNDRIEYPEGFIACPEGNIDKPERNIAYPEGNIDQPEANIAEQGGFIDEPGVYTRSLIFLTEVRRRKEFKRRERKEDAEPVQRKKDGNLKNYSYRFFLYIKRIFLSLTKLFPRKKDTT
jgi:hypothetical protein